MVSTITSLSALFTGFALLCLGHGLNNTLLGVRAVEENFSGWTIAWMTSAYFAGFIAGTRISTVVLASVGHIRCFSAFASMASAVSLAYLLVISEPGWVVMRFLYGLCMAAIYVSLESWLSALSNRANRGSIMSVYMIINFGALSAGQLLMLVDTPGGHELFLVVSILISLALVPVSVSNRLTPRMGESAHMNFPLLLRMNRAAVIGVIGLGLSLGSYWGLGPAYLSRAGMSAGDVARFLSAGFIGGLLLQWPLGILSDRVDRRVVISGTLVLAMVASVLIAWMLGSDPVGWSQVLVIVAFFFGGSCYTLYSLFVSLANDFLEAGDMVAACAGLIMLQALGALFGPMLVMPLAQAFGPAALFLFFAVIQLFMLGMTLRDYLLHRVIPAATHSHFAAMPRTGPLAAELEPLAKDQPAT